MIKNSTHTENATISTGFVNFGDFWLKNATMSIYFIEGLMICVANFFIFVPIIR
jgi:hypothetical protein